jgi:hypothetical protein
LSYRSSFVEPWLQCHICEGHVDRSIFPWRMINAVSMMGVIATIGVGQLCARRNPIGGLSGLVSDLSDRYLHEIVHGHAHVQIDPVNFCVRTCAHMHKTDLPITPNKRHARYCMDIISSTSMRRDSSTQLFLLLHIASNSSAHCTKDIEVMCIIPQHN